MRSREEEEEEVKEQRSSRKLCLTFVGERKRRERERRGECQGYRAILLVGQKTRVKYSSHT